MVKINLFIMCIQAESRHILSVEKELSTIFTPHNVSLDDAVTKFSGNFVVLNIVIHYIVSITNVTKLAA